MAKPYVQGVKDGEDKGRYRGGEHYVPVVSEAATLFTLGLVSPGMTGDEKDREEYLRGVRDSQET